MTGLEITLLILAFVGALVSCGFGIVWLRTRDDLVDAKRQWQGSEAERQVAEAKVAQVDAKLRKAVNAFNDLRSQAKQKIEEASKFGHYWKDRFERIAHWESVEDAVGKAREIQDKVADLERTAEALRNAVEGYDSRYVLPQRSVLDDLASDAGHTDAGQRLKAAREAARKVVKRGEAVSSNEEDPERKALIEGFVVDAFNCKVEAIMEAVKADNIGTLMQRVNDAFLLVNRQSKVFANARILKPYLKARLEELRWASLVQQYKAEAREEQRRIKQRMREEAKAQREFERAQKEAKEREDAILRERRIIAEAQEKATRDERARQEARLQEELARVTGQQRQELEARLRAEMDAHMASTTAEFADRLADADARIKELEEQRVRAMSMAQQTRRGTVYVISNLGSFGDGVYKIGQTRRLDPLERIWELGDASVPFDFDVHALIASDDAPALERALHERFVAHQVNKVNWRKEFFRIGLDEIRQAAEEMGANAAWTMISEAPQYRETLVIEAKMESEPEYREQWIREQLGVSEESEVGPEIENDDSDIS